LSDRKTALITGASSGIGYELARLFARDQHNLVLVARSRDKLVKLAADLEKEFGTKSLIVAVDLSAVDGAELVVDQTHKSAMAVDVLVNNAGFGQYGMFDRTDPHEMTQQIQLNVAALTQLTRAYLPEMLERGSGRILNVASTAAYQPGPLMAVYYATKAYVLSFSEAVANELEGSGVTVTCLCPGPTTTEFHKRAEMEDSRLLRLGRMDAASVAEIGYRGMQAGRRVVIAGLQNRLLAQAVRFAPRRFVTAMVRKIQERSRSSTH
jgi:short-subunit dehydrogenase